MGGKLQYLKVSKELIKLIETGVFQAGCRLPATRDLATQFGVGRAVIREAQIALQAQGVLIIKPRSGAYVSSKSKLVLCGSPQIELFELTEAQAIIAVESAVLAAPIITDKTIAELESFIPIMSGCKKTNMTPWDANIAFHTTIARATNNHVIILMIESMWEMRRETINFNDMNQCNFTQFSNNHKDILQALKNRDAASVRVAMRAYFTRLMEYLISASEKEAFEKMQSKVSETRSRFMLSAQLS